MTEEMKRCSKCGEVKPVSEFYRNSSRGGRPRSECKECRAESQRKWREQNREKEVERIRKYYAAHPEKMAEYYKCTKNPSCPRVGQRGAEFMTFTCEVCGKEFRRRKADVDWKYEHEGRLPRFCSKECQFTARRKGYKSPYARKIEEIKRRVRA